MNKAKGLKTESKINKQNQSKLDIKWEQAEELLRQASWIKIQANFMIENEFKYQWCKNKVIECINQIIASKSLYTVIKEKFKIKIKRYEMELLNWEKIEWLNDNLVNFYMKMITERSANDKSLPKTYAFETFFMEKLKNNEFERLKIETNKIDIFEYEKLLVPIHKGNHWCLMIINMNIKLIQHYDSNGGSNGGLQEKMREYLCKEYLFRKKKWLDLKEWSSPSDIWDVKSPSQENGSDCGVFVCTYADMESLHLPIIFDQSEVTFLRQKMMCEIYAGELLYTELLPKIED